MACWRGHSRVLLSVDALLCRAGWHRAASFSRKRGLHQSYQANLQESCESTAVFLQIWLLSKADISLLINGL
jgi:hypothetical protein